VTDKNYLLTVEILEVDEMNTHWYLLACCVAVLDEYEDASEHKEALWSHPYEDIDIDLKVIVPTGYIFAVDRLNPSHVLWQQKVY